MHADRSISTTSVHRGRLGPLACFDHPCTWRTIKRCTFAAMSDRAPTSQKNVLRLGLTGSIGMGKSTVAKMFVKQGIPLWDADEAVHELYSAGGEAVEPVSIAFPGCGVDGAVSRPLLGPSVVGNEEGIKKLESIVHPLVAKHRQCFLQRIAEKPDQKLVVLDIPLLFETHGEDQTDSIVVVSAPLDVQRTRVLARPGMTSAKFEAILKRQTPDDVKRQRADFVIDTACSEQETEQQVAIIIKRLQLT